MFEKSYEACVIPMLGFCNRKSRDDYTAGVCSVRAPMTGEGAGRFFVENLEGWHGSTTELLTNRHLMRRDRYSGKPVFQRLNNGPNELPDGAYNVLALAGGKRSFRPGDGDYRKSKALWEIGLEPRDCLVIWEDQDQNRLREPPVTMTVPTDSNKEGVTDTTVMVHPKRWVCGVIVARTLGVNINIHGGADHIGWVETLRWATIRIDILDRDKSKGDVLRTWINQGWSRGYGDNPATYHPMEEDAWSPLVRQAIAEFDDQCVTCTPELRERYAALLRDARIRAREIERARKSQSRW